MRARALSSCGGVQEDNFLGPRVLDSSLHQHTYRQTPVRACAILVHWGDPAPTLAAAAQRVGDGAVDKVVVIANDGRPPPRGLPAEVKWEMPPRNLGYGAACQYGVERHPAHVYAILNTDVTISGPDLRRCILALDLPGIGIVGPILVYPDGKLQSACGSHTRYTWASCSHAMPTAEVTSCAWVTGAVMVCKAAVLRDVGFDGSYFLYYEDADLCHRARAVGWTVAIVASAHGLHFVSQTIKSFWASYYLSRNRIWIAREHGGVLPALLTTAWLLVGHIPRMLVADVAKHRSIGNGVPAMRGVIDAWRLQREFGVPLPDEPIPAGWGPW